MEIIARSQSVRIAPRKVRLVADAVRALSIEAALSSLLVLNKRAAGPLLKTLKSAIANAKNNNKIEVENLKIKTIDVLEAPAYKRFHPSTRGRVHPYKRKGSHIRIVLTEKVEAVKSEVVEAEIVKTEVKKEKK